MLTNTVLYIMIHNTIFTNFPSSQHIDLPMS